MAKRKEPASEATDAVAAQPRSSIRVEGKHAKKLHGIAPGKHVKIVIHGKMVESGTHEFGGHHARIEVSRVAPIKGKSKNSKLPFPGAAPEFKKGKK